MSTSMTDEEAAEFYDVIGQTVNNQTKKGAIDDKWVEACGASRKAIHRQIKEKYGEDAEVEFCGWDLQSDVEDGIGLGNYKEDKGFSTDAYFRVKTKDGPKVHEVSLKKDRTANLLNSTSGRMADIIIRGNATTEEYEKYDAIYAKASKDRTKEEKAFMKEIEEKLKYYKLLVPQLLMIKKMN